MDIRIKRYSDDQSQMTIAPDDGRWQLVVDKEGIPYLYVRVKGEPNSQGQGAEGLLCVDDMLPVGCKTKDLMLSEFGPPLEGEEEDAAYAEYMAEREENPIPCPR